MNKNILIAAVLILVAGGIYAGYGNNAAFKQQQLPTYAADNANTRPIADASTSASVAKHAVTWKFTPVSNAASKPSDAPKTRVTVTWDGKSHDAGTYQGSCTEIDGSNGTLSDGEVSGALCWFAGSGDEIGIFNENGTFVLKHGEQQESSGEGQGFRGNFKTLITL